MNKDIEARIKQIRSLLDECAKISEETGDPFSVSLGQTGYLPKKAVARIEELDAKQDESGLTNDEEAELETLRYSYGKYNDGDRYAGWQWQPSSC